METRSSDRRWRLALAIHIARVGNGGAGAGGSIRIEGGDVSLSNVSAAGGSLYNAGSRGRIAIYYADNYTSGNFTPQYLQKQNAPDTVLQDEFESNDLTYWASSSATDGGDLSVSTEASRGDKYGLKAVINDNNSIYARDDMSIDEGLYRQRFYFDPNSVVMGSSDILLLSYGRNASTSPDYAIFLEKVSGTYKIDACALDNSSTWTCTNLYNLANDWNAVEISYQAAPNEGALSLWVNGNLQQTLSHINNDAHKVNAAFIGAINVPTGTRGTIYFDSFESRRFSYIGILPGLDAPLATPTPQASWVSTTYTYGTSQPHALTTDSNGNSYQYDENGNMTCRVENGISFAQSYNAENRLATVTKLSSGGCNSEDQKKDMQWDFTYDGDGTRVRQVVSTYDQNTPQNVTNISVTAYFMGGLYEVTDSNVTKYYAIAGMIVAVNDGTGMKYLLTDHLGSVAAVTDASGTVLSQQRYLPFGQKRPAIDPLPLVTQTDFGYTGQRALDNGLMDYHARMYDPYITHFSQPDDIIPDEYNPQSLNRYSYALNNPIQYNDPSGHCPICLIVVVVVAAAVLTADVPHAPQPNPNQGAVDAIRDSAANAADALVKMFSTDRLPGNTPAARLDTILNATKSGPYSHFAVNFDDSGFKSEYQDPYPSSRNQVGHFLTAIDIMMNANNLLGKSAIVGHEMYPDFGGQSGITGGADNLIQTGYGLTHPADTSLFSLGNDDAFNTIIGDGWGPNGIRTGNSIQDLRLSYLALQMAEKYRSGSFKDNASVGKWLKLKIMQ